MPDGNVPAGFVPLDAKALSLTLVLSSLVTLYLMANRDIALDLLKRSACMAVLHEFLEVVNDEIPKIQP